MDYTEVKFYNDAALNDAIIAWLGESGFEMFEERADGVNAYIPANFYTEKLLDEVFSVIPDAQKNIKYETRHIRQENWNEKWEKSFEPVRISNRILIRAPFHEPDGNIEFDLVIEPKMSFGTGHHATTSLMMQMMLETNMDGKIVLDMGCGTGILSVLAEKLRATKITAIDIEEWAYENALENCSKNDCSKIEVYKGDFGLISGKTFDIILANINRNILTSQIPVYSDSMNAGGQLLMSGILMEDRNVIEECAVGNGFTIGKQLVQDNWMAVRYIKK